MSVRKQLYLTEEQENLLKRRARATRRSEAALVREAIERCYGFAADPREDPLLKIRPFGGKGPSDLGAEHDHYLYGWPKKRRGRR